jgi:hypothetical protein
VDSSSKLVSFDAQFNQGWQRAALGTTSQSDIRAPSVIVKPLFFERGTVR